MTWPCLANPFSLSILQAGLGKNANQLDKLPLSITSFLRTFFNWWTWTFTMTQSSWQRQSCALQFNSDAPSFKLTAWSLPEHMAAKFQAWPMRSAKGCPCGGADADATSSAWRPQIIHHASFGWSPNRFRLRFALWRFSFNLKSMSVSAPLVWKFQDKLGETNQSWV